MRALANPAFFYKTLVNKLANKIKGRWCDGRSARFWRKIGLYGGTQKEEGGNC